MIILKLHVVKTPIGIFAFSINGELSSYQLFSSKPETAAKNFEANIPEDFAGGHEISEDSIAKQTVRKNFRKLAMDLGFVKSDSELNAFMAEFCYLISKKNLKGAIGRDKLIVQASNALEDIMKMQNQATMRIAEWYGLHYPEAKIGQNDIEKIIDYGSREKWPGFKESTGAELNSADEKILRDYATTAKRLAEQRKNLEKYVKDSMFEIAPNFTSVIDPQLAARILALAGSMEKLSKLSASSIQLIGAEKALFRHLRQKGKSPKYGILFLSSVIQATPDDQRGKIARILAAKLMQAARIDYFSGRDESERIKKELNNEIKDVLARKG